MCLCVRQSIFVCFMSISTIVKSFFFASCNVRYVYYTTKSASDGSMQYLFIVQFCSGKGWGRRGRKLGWLYNIVGFKFLWLKKETN